MTRKIKILTDVDGTKNLTVTGTLEVKADSTFVIPTISTSSGGFYSINSAMHKIDQSLQEVNARVVSSVGNVLGQYNASRYVFSGYFNASGSATVNITRNSPSGSVYFKESDISNISVNILTDFDGDGIFTNNLVPFQLRPSGGELFLDISAPSAPYIMYKATVTNDAAIVDIPSQNSVYMVQSGSSTVDGQTVLLDSTKLYNKSTRNFYVSVSGSDANDGLTLTSSFATIQKAIDSLPTYNNSAVTRVQYHTIINVASGTYNERVNIFNKSYAGKNSNLLALVRGAKEILYENLSITSEITTDPDSGDTNGFRSIVMNFPTPPPDNSLKGCFINRKINEISVDFSIIGNSGSTLYIPLTNFASYLSTKDFYIFRNASTVNGYFRIAGTQGVVTFRNLNLNVPLNEGNSWDSYFFSTTYHPIGTIDINNTGDLIGGVAQTRYGSYSNDETQIISCNITEQNGSKLIVGPKTYFLYTNISSSYSSPASMANVNQVDSFNAIGSYFENINLSFVSVPIVYFFNCATLNGGLYFTSCDNVTLPRKIMSNKTNGDRVNINNSLALTPQNSYYKKIGFDVSNKSSFSLYSPFTAHGPFNGRFLNLTNNVFMEFGNVNTTSSFSGTCGTDWLMLAVSKCNINFNSVLDLRNVYSARTNPLIGSYRSDMIFLYHNPLTASVGSANYRSFGDIAADDNYFFFTDLPVITAETTKLDNRLKYADAKINYVYPLQTTKDITLTGSAQLVSSLVKLNPYTTLPAGSLGLMAVSGSSLYFHNGTSWNKVI